jgi:hypothetical protein
MAYSGAFPREQSERSDADGGQQQGGPEQFCGDADDHSTADDRPLAAGSHRERGQRERDAGGQEQHA